MNSFLRSALLVATASGLVTIATAAAPVAYDRRGVEALASEVVLPSSTTGTLVMKECPKCPLKSYPVSAATTYALYKEPVTLAELTAALAGKPKAFVGVVYSAKSGQIISVNAHAARVNP